MVGKKFGAYEIKEEIGRGGMGIVYRAVQISLGREVAIKVLPPQLAVEKEFVKRFYREAQSAANLKHPNIVTIHDVGEEDGTYYFAMEYLDGGSLEDRIEKQGAYSLEEAVAIISQMAVALDYAHKNGIIHRDIKPGNIIIDEEGRAVITDFGIAKAAYDQKLTKTGMTVGSPEYMSPEQVKGREIDGRADLYALGIVFYRMLCGEVPFTGDSAVSIAYQHVNEPIPPISALRPDLPQYADRILQKLLAKDPDNRFQSGRELIQSLQNKTAPMLPVEEPADPAPTPQGPHPPPQPLPMDIKPDFSYEAEKKKPFVRGGGNRKLIYALGAVLCVLAITIIFILVLSKEKPTYAPVRGGGGGGGRITPFLPTRPDLHNPADVANAMLAALKKTDIEAMRNLLTEEQRQEMEGDRSDNPERFRQEMKQASDMLVEISAIGELRRNPANDTVNAFIFDMGQQEIIYFEMTESISGYKISNMSIMPSAVFQSWPVYNPVTDRHNYAAAASVAGQALAAIKTMNIDSLYALMSPEFKEETGVLTPENRARIRKDLEEIGIFVSDVFRIREIRKDSAGLLIAKLAEMPSYDILFVGLKRAGTTYQVHVFDEIDMDEFQNLPLVWQAP